MTGRTFAIGDIHGDMDALGRVMGKLPKLVAADTIVFMGDYVDRGHQSRQVIEFIRTELPKTTKAKIVALRGNHEDGWLRVREGGWPEFVLPVVNGCLAFLRSYTGSMYFPGDIPTDDELRKMYNASFIPDEVLAWMRGLAHFYEDEHAIYVHAGLPKLNGKWLHPSDVKDPTILLWLRTAEFFKDYRGKRVVVGHTSTDNLPPELSSFTPEDPLDMWAGENVLAIDTGSGKGGFLTCVELPAVKVYESR
ncbi:MAG: metallophosphoesterase [Polyangiaceae bacterium]